MGFFVFVCFPGSKKKMGVRGTFVRFKQHKPWGRFAAECAKKPEGREASRELDAGLNTTTMDYHSIKLRLGFTACRRDTVRGGAKEGGIPNTHKQASIVHIPPRQRRKK